MKQALKMLVILSLLFGAISCQPQPDEQPLTTDLDLTQLETFESVKDGISFGVPAGWQVVESAASLVISPDPYATTNFLKEPTYSLNMMSRRLGGGLAGLAFPKSAYQIASRLRNPSLDLSSYSFEPITRTTVSGREGAYYSRERDYSLSLNHQSYIIVIELTDREVVVLMADAPEEDAELMRSTLNAIALTVEPLGDTSSP